MRVKLTEDWHTPSGMFFEKGTILDMHPVEGNALVREKKAKKYKQFKILK